MSLRRAGLAFGCAVLAGCVADLELPSEVRIHCDPTAADCPQGYRCPTEAGYCVPTAGADKTAPSPTQAVVWPERVAAGQVLRVSFSIDEPLLVTPLVRLRIGDYAASLSREDALGSTSFTYALDITGDEPQGVATISASLIDPAGNTAPETNLGAATLDFAPPVFTSIDFANTLAAAGEEWIATATVPVEVEAVDALTGLAAVEIDGDINAPGLLPFSESFDLELTPGDGVKVISLRLFDGAGNATEPAARVLHLNQSSPSNRVVVDVPDTPELWLNQDFVSVYFHSDGPLPDDFDAYVLSTDAGASWQVIGTSSPCKIELAQDATTTAWIKERDLFGGMTPDAAAGVVILHEDSVPPTQPVLAVHSIVARLSDRVGVALLAPSTDNSGPVTYEVLGGIHRTFAPIGTGTWLMLPGVRPAGDEYFAIRATDRAGNKSDVTFVVAADDPIQATDSFGCAGSACFMRNGWTSRDGSALYRERLVNSPARRLIYACTQPADAAFTCGELDWYDAVGNDDYSSIDIYGRYVVWSRAAAGAEIYDLGADMLANTGDDVGPTVLRNDGRCTALADNGVIYVRADGKAYLYAFDADKTFNGAFDGGHERPLNIAASFDSIDRCRLQFNGRQLVWTEGAGGSPSLHAYNLGADRAPGGGDDVGPTTVPGTTAALSSNCVLLFGDSVAAQRIDLGRDETLGTADDTPVTLDGAIAAGGDKILMADTDDRALILDVSSNVSMPFANLLHSRAVSTAISFGAGRA